MTADQNCGRHGKIRSFRAPFARDTRLPDVKVYAVVRSPEPEEIPPRPEGMKRGPASHPMKRVEPRFVELDALARQGFVILAIDVLSTDLPVAVKRSPVRDGYERGTDKSRRQHLPVADTIAVRIGKDGARPIETFVEVIHTVSIRVSGSRIRPELKLLAVQQPVAVRIGIRWIGPQTDLLTVKNPVSVGVGVARISAVKTFERIGNAIVVRIR